MLAQGGDKCIKKYVPQSKVGHSQVHPLLKFLFILGAQVPVARPLLFCPPRIPALSKAHVAMTSPHLLGEKSSFLPRPSHSRLYLFALWLLPLLIYIVYLCLSYLFQAQELCQLPLGTFRDAQRGTFADSRCLVNI